MLYIAERIITTIKARLSLVVPPDTDYWKAIAEKTPEFNVGIEGFAFGARGAQNDLGEIQGVVKSQLWLALGVEPVIITSSTARKAVMGKGNFPKKDILATLVKRGLELKDHNEADAYVIAECLRLSTLKGAE
jgi:Holliday junction resolvasome RuvABC endonuclease subunit